MGAPRAKDFTGVLPENRAKALTDKQEKFAIAYVLNNGNAKAAAVEAGYSHADSAYDLVGHPAVAAKIKELRRIKIEGGLASVALKTLEDIMTGIAYPAAARVSAAKTVLEMAGLGVTARGQNLRYGLDNEGKPLTEMTTGELEQFIGRQQAALDSLKDVSRTVNAPVYELEDSESMDCTAPLGQLCIESVTVSMPTTPAPQGGPIPPHPPASASA